MKITEEHKKACQLLRSRSEWGYVEEVLNLYLEGLKDMTTLDEEEKKIDKNIVFEGRIMAYKALKNFLNTIGLLGQENKNSEDSYE
jgi:hypothetical protein